jgi:hypothetical protein
LLVANAEVLTQAQPHQLVQNLGTTDRNNLLAYLSQLDGRDASGTPLPAPSAPSPQAPSIVSGPQSSVVAESSALNFVAVVSGTGPFTFVWRRGTTVIGTNSAALSIPSMSAGEAGSYTVEVTNAHGSITSTHAEVTVNPALAITTTILPVATVGVPFSASLSAVGGVSSRTWSLESGLLPPGLTLSAVGVLSGTATAPARATITVRVSDASGSDTQALTVNAAPVGGFVSDPDLILHYTFDEGSSTRVWDSATGGNNHTTDVPGAHWISDGRFGGAFGPGSTNAGMQNFTPANQADLSLDPLAQAFTISLWCRTTASGYNTLFSKDGGDPYRIQHRLWIAPTQLQGINGNQYGGQIASEINDGQWHLVTMVNFNDAGTWRTRVYYDNGTQSTTFNTGAGGTVSELLRIGGLSAGWNGWFGQIDDFRVYRRALSQSEIAALHATPDVESFAEWITTHLTPAQQSNPALNGPEDDANGNGVPNAIEFALGNTELSPLHLELIGMPENRLARLTLTRNSAARGVTIIVESTTDFVTWTPLATSLNGDTPTGPATISEGAGIIRVMQVETPATSSPAFFRVRTIFQ